jgi:hypothetical protein
MISPRFLILVFLLFSLAGAEKVWGQCGPCNVTLTANNNPVISDGDVVCLNVNRSNPINLGDADNITVCISTGITYSNNFSGLNGDNVVINNYGQIGTSGTPRNIILANNGIFNNFGNYFGNFTSNGGSDLNNSGSFSGNVILNSTGAVFNNSGSQNGSLTINNNTLVNSGTLSLTSLSIGGSSTGITNTSSGNIILDQNSDFSINAPFNNAGNFSFTRDNRNFSIASGVTITNTGTFSVGRNFSNNGTFNSSEGILDVGRDLTNNGSAILNLGNTTVASDFTNNNLTTISGSLEIGNDLTNNGSAIIRPLNTNQCNTIFVNGDFGNNNTNGITGSNLTGPYRAPLIVNQAPSPRGLVGNAIVDPNLDCSCGTTFTNSGSFIVPAGVTQITMKAWGGGGKGGNRDSNGGRSGGGGAGAYSESTITVTQGETLYYFSGQGSSNSQPGGDSWASRASNGSNPILLAKGGLSVSNNDEDGAQGGRANQGVGNIRTNGGNGSDSDENGGDGGNSPNGGDGGNGATGNNSNGINGNSPGGGGGGAKTNGNSDRDGGNGGNGQVTFSYSCEESVDPPGGGCWRYIDDGTSSGVVILEFFEDCTWDAPKGLLEFEVLAIGGGGGGGVRSGGGGGGGGAVHARALVEVIFNQGLAAGRSFSIVVGNGGEGSSVKNEKGENGLESRFDFGGDYQIVAGAGGGGGSDDNNADDGNPGSGSSYNSSTTGFSIISSEIYGGSGGGGGHNGNRGNGSFRNGGNAADHSGAGGGGLSGNNGSNAANDDRGGDGANGKRFSTFDITLNRFFGAGGAGGSRDNFTASGGSSGAGGNGGREDGNNATNGGNGTTPGSGGGGGGHDENIGGGRGAKGVVIVRYEIARILPVEYLYFKADFNSFLRSGELSWATAQEWENSHFEIERSVNNVKDWELIGQIDGAGYSDRPVEYKFQDLNLPLAGGNIFYRLKQVDLKGEFTYSITKAIQVSPLAGTTNWRVYPNPTTGDFINLEMLDKEAFRDEKITVRVISVTGQSDLIEAYSPAQLSGELSNALSGKSAGVYTLEITWGKKKEYHKVILNR